MLAESRRMSSPGYIAYIDEAGDDGLRQIKTRDQTGSSEWLVLSAVVVRADREKEVIGWVRDIVAAMQQKQLTHLHYAKLSPEKRLLACELLAQLPLRIFVVLSHKRNMQNYRNIRAERANVNRTARFYAWIARLLLERVTGYCGRRSEADYGEFRPVRFEFSDRGGVKIAEVKDYFRLLEVQTRLDMVHLTTGNLDWRVVDVEQMLSYPNRMRAGLQLADIAASAFFSGLELTPQGKTDPTPAKALASRVARGVNRKRFSHGVKVMPDNLRPLPPEQEDLITFYREK